MSKVGANIRILREEKKLSQEAFAEKLYLEPQVIVDYEEGNAEPDIDTLIRISDLLEVDIHKLIFEPKPKTDVKKALISTIIPIILVCLYGFLLFKLGTYIQEWTRRNFNLTPSILYLSILKPLLFIFIGMSIVQLAKFLLVAKPLQNKQIKIIHIIVCALFIAYIIGVLPFLFERVADTFGYLQARKQGLGYESSSALPHFWGYLSGQLMYFINKVPFLTTILGAIFALTRVPRTKKFGDK